MVLGSRVSFIPLFRSRGFRTDKQGYEDSPALRYFTQHSLGMSLKTTKHFLQQCFAGIDTHNSCYISTVAAWSLSQKQKFLIALLTRFIRPEFIFTLSASIGLLWISCAGKVRRNWVSGAPGHKSTDISTISGLCVITLQPCYRFGIGNLADISF